MLSYKSTLAHLSASVVLGENREWIFLLLLRLFFWIRDMSKRNGQYSGTVRIMILLPQCKKPHNHSVHRSICKPLLTVKKWTKEFDIKSHFIFFVSFKAAFFPLSPSFFSYSLPFLPFLKENLFPMAAKHVVKGEKIIFTNWFSFSASGALSHFVCRFPVSIRMDFQTSDDVKNYLIWITWNQTTKTLLMREIVVSSFLWCAISIRLCKLRQFEIFNQPLLISIC